MTLMERFRAAVRGAQDRKRHLAQVQVILAKLMPGFASPENVEVDGVLVLVQYSPGSPSTEKKIWEFCESLHRALIVPLVMTDGAEGHLYTELFSFFPSHKAKQNTSSMMVDAGRLTGTEAFCISSDSPPPLYGLDSRTLYIQNFEAAELANTRSGSLAELRQAANRLRSLPATVSPALAALTPLCSLSLTHAEWDAFRETWTTPNSFLDALHPLLTHTSVSNDLRSRFGELLQASFNFYSCASQRSALMPENAFRHIAETGALWAVAVVAGFHADVLSGAFRERNWAVYTVSL